MAGRRTSSRSAAAATREDGAREPAKSAKAERRQAALRLLQDPSRRRGGEGAAGQAGAAGSLARRQGRRAIPGRAPARRRPSPTRASAADSVAAVDPAAKAPDRFWLQAGSFANESDAENLRARLALAGWEAQLQQGTLPDKATRYRVRLGPYDNVDELNRIKGELARRGFDVAVIRTDRGDGGGTSCHRRRDQRTLIRAARSSRRIVTDEVRATLSAPRVAACSPCCRARALGLSERCRAGPGRRAELPAAQEPAAGRHRQEHRGAVLLLLRLPALPRLRSRAAAVARSSCRPTSTSSAFRSTSAASSGRTSARCSTRSRRSAPRRR